MYDAAGLAAILSDISKAKASGAAAAAAGQQQKGKSRKGSRAGTQSSVEAAAEAAEAAGRSGSSGVAAMAALPPGVSVTRFKGLGEMMPEQLWSTTLNPATRSVSTVARKGDRVAGFCSLQQGFACQTAGSVFAQPCVWALRSGAVFHCVLSQGFAAADAGRRGSGQSHLCHTHG